jgi:transposase-like protein
MERRKFTREFKLEAVRLIRDRGVSYVQASADLGVHATQLRNWVKAQAEIAPEVTGHGLPLSKCEAYNRVYDQHPGTR